MIAVFQSWLKQPTTIIGLGLFGAFLTGLAQGHSFSSEVQILVVSVINLVINDHTANK